MSFKLNFKPAALLSCALIILLAFSANAQTLPQQDDAANEKPADASVLMRQLTDRDALVRQRAAEELARRADTRQRKLVEGYRLQEKHPRVRLALDWALYRMGKPDTLYTVVRDLDSTRYNQSEAYLGQLETPEPLHAILPRVNGNTQIKLLEALARTGNAATLEIVRPYAESPDFKIADAARFATREITRRLEAPPHPDTKTRTRQPGKVASDTP
jgi:HEAT repeat protein